MSSLKAGLNKVVLQQMTQDSENKIIVQEHLKEKQYKIVSIGNPRSTFDIAPTFTRGAIAHLAPGSGHIVKVDGTEYVVCGFDEILITS